MATNLRLTNPNIASITTSRLLTIPTSPATKIVLSSGATMMWISNVGPSTIAWGDTGVTASTGNLLFYSMNQKFDYVASDFFLYAIADSAAGTLAVIEAIA